MGLPRVRPTSLSMPASMVHVSAARADSFEAAHHCCSRAALTLYIEHCWQVCSGHSLMRLCAHNMFEACF